MADDITAIRKKYSRPYSDPLNPPDKSEINQKVSEKQRRLWTALIEFINANGGTVVSIPFLKNLRLEVAPGSPLPAKLLEFGYSVHHAGTDTRIAPTGKFVPRDIIEIVLPGK
jgi:hypothetical protein